MLVRKRRLPEFVVVESPDVVSPWKVTNYHRSYGLPRCKNNATCSTVCRTDLRICGHFLTVSTPHARSVTARIDTLHVQLPQDPQILTVLFLGGIYLLRVDQIPSSIPQEIARAVASVGNVAKVIGGARGDVQHLVVRLRPQQSVHGRTESRRPIRSANKAVVVTMRFHTSLLWGRPMGKRAIRLSLPSLSQWGSFEG